MEQQTAPLGKAELLELKPGNVLLHNGRWKLADFGIARDAELGTQTVTFLGAGTPAYMAPEIWNDEPLAEFLLVG